MTDARQMGLDRGETAVDSTSAPKRDRVSRTGTAGA